MDSAEPKKSKGGRYYRFTRVVAVILALTFLTLLILVLLPDLTERKYQNLISKKISEYKFAFNQKKSTTEPTPTPLPPRPIPHGKIGFTVGQSDKTVPLFGRGFIDPYDPDKGGTQTVTISVSYKNPVSKVTAILKTDNDTSEAYSFKLVNGSDTEGEWQGSWKVTDTYLYTYALVFNAESSNKSGSVEVTLR